MIHSLKLFAWNGAKITLCGAIIAAIGFAFVILTPQGEIDEADADIFWFGPGSLQDSKHERFVDMLDDQGFSEPQPYEWNGNMVYFSHGQTSESPREVSSRLQEALVREGINDRSYPIPADPNVFQDPSASRLQLAYSALAMEEYFSGGMVPIIDTGDYVALNGLEAAVEGGNVQHLGELRELMWSAPTVDAAMLFNNIRYVEAFRPRGSRTTHKIAIFGDENMDLRQFQPGGGGFNVHRSAEDAVPACPGCQRVSQFSGLESQAGSEIETYDSPDTTDGVISFYHRALLARGWRVSETMQEVQQMRAMHGPYRPDEHYGEMVAFERGEDTVHIHAYPADGAGTSVNIFRGR